MPADAGSSPVSLIVNGRQASGKLTFIVPGDFPYCGYILKMLAMADGSLLVQYSDSAPVAWDRPLCPSLPSSARGFVFKETSQVVLVIDDSTPTPQNEFRRVTTIALDRSKEHYAILGIKPRGAPEFPILTIDYQGIRSEIPLPLGPGGAAADFGPDGNLFVAFHDLTGAGLSLVRIAASALATGGSSPVETLATHLEPLACSALVDLAANCQADVYVGIVNRFAKGDPACTGETSMVRRFDLATRQVVQDIPVTNGQLNGIDITCKSGELLGGTLTDPDTTDAEVWRSQDGSAPQAIDHLDGGFANVLVTVAPDGSMYSSHRGRGLFAISPHIEPCAPSVSPPPICQAVGMLMAANQACTPVPTAQAACTNVPQEPIVILPSTIRWRVWRDTTNPIKIEFSSTKPLLSATVNITGPATLVPLFTTFDPANPPNPYSVNWATTDSAGKPLPAGDYTINIVGQAESGDVMSSEPNDRVVSLVEVNTVRLDRLATNPQLEVNPGPGGGQRIFPEADGPAGQVGDKDKVKIVVTIFPAVADPGAQGPVNVYLRGIDVDDPSANGTPIDDENQPSDNCRGGGCQVPASGRINGTDASTPLAVAVPSGQDQVTAIFQVSERQGDNYRIVASTSSAWIDATNVSARQRSATGEVVHASGEQLSQGTQLTEMLTAWRTLNLEVDRLDSTVLQQVGPDPSGQKVVLDLVGSSTALQPQRLTDSNTAFIFGPSGSDHGAGDSWEGADLWPAFAGPLTGTSVRVFGNGRHSVDTDPAMDLTTIAAVGNRYRLSDDRDVTLTGRLPFGLLKTLLARAYIATKTLIGVDDVNFQNPRFRLQMTRNLDDAALASIPKDLTSSRQFWTVQTVDGFEGRVGGDNDPNTESGTLGTTPGNVAVFPPSGISALSCQDSSQPVSGIFRETIRDAGEENGYGPDALETVTAHEVICHGMRVGHTPVGLCGETLLSGTAGRVLADDYIAELRGLAQPTLCVTRPCPTSPPPKPAFCP